MHSSSTEPKVGIIFLWIITSFLAIINGVLRKPISYKGYGGWIFFQILLAVFFLIILFSFLNNLPLKKGSKIVGIITLSLIFVLGGFKLIQGISNITKTSQQSCTRRMAPSSDLQDCDLRGITLTDGDLSGAKLSGANFDSAKLSGMNLSNADLMNANFYESVQANMNFSNANLSGADFLRAELTSVNFTNSDLFYANFKYCKMDEVNFTKANLQDANFFGVVLHDVNLQGAYLENVDLGETDPIEISGLVKDQLVNVDWVFNPANYQSVCNGDQYPYGVPYQKVAGIHPTVVLVYRQDENSYSFDGNVLYEKWEPKDIFETELVTCVEIHYESIEDCRYGTLGFDHAYRMRGTIHASLFEVLTGKLLESKTFTQEPRPCPDSMNFSCSGGVLCRDNKIYGSTTPASFVSAWLKPYVEVP